MTINATFWTFAAMEQYVAAIPYTTNGAATGPYIWTNQGIGNTFARPAGAPGCRVGAIVSQFLFLADLYQQQQQLLFTSNGSQTTFTGSLFTPMTQTGLIFDQQGTISSPFSAGSVTPSGALSGGTVNYATGAVSLTFSAPPLPGNNIYAQYIQVAPYRNQWSAIGNPISWPTPLTNAALAAQSGFNDLETDLGQIMFIAGYPLYGLIFQTTGITRASYIGGNVVFSWQPYEFKRGCIAHGSAVKVGPVVYFLAGDGFYATDGANVIPIGTASDNSGGIDKWFWSNVNTSALESIRAGFDASKRSVFFAIPTGSNVLPDTLLIYNTLAQKWTRAQVAVETIWTDDNGADGTPGTQEILGVVDQGNNFNNVLGSPPLTGYLESCDLLRGDGRYVVTEVRPHSTSTDLPLVTVGARNSLNDAVTYGTSWFTDGFSRTAPAATGGIYLRARVQSTNATSFQGATLRMTRDGNL